MNDKGFITAVNQQSTLWLTSYKKWLKITQKKSTELLHKYYKGYCICCKQSTNRALDICEDCQNSLSLLKNSCSQCAESMMIKSTKDTNNEPPRHICGECIIKPPSFYCCYALWHYAFPIDQLIKQYKYQQKANTGKVLAQLYAQHLISIQATADFITFVPMHWQRRSQCDFNHGEQLATSIGKQMSIPVKAKLLKKIKANPKQHSLNKQQRQHNLKNSFTINPAINIKGKTIALVDDVMTTGSTAEVISKLLLKAGAKKVEIWCLARVTKIGNAATL